MIHHKIFPINIPLVSTSAPKSRKKLHHHLENMLKGRKEEWELELHTNLLIHTAVLFVKSQVQSWKAQSENIGLCFAVL